MRRGGERVYVEEFVGERLTELLRFAVVLTGDERRAQDLVVDTVRHAGARWNAVLSLGRPFSVVRGGVARAYLADDASAPVARPTEEFAALTPLQRAALVLTQFAGQSAAEAAVALDVTEAAVTDAHAAGVAALGLAPGAESGALVTDLLDSLAEEVHPDADAARAALDAAGPAQESPEEFAALFGTPADPPPVATPAPRYVLDEPPAPAEPVVAEPAAAEPAAAAAGHRRRAGVVASLVLLAVLAVVVSVLVAHRTTTPSGAPSPTAVPSARTAALPTVTSGSITAALDTTLPGGRVLGQFFGAGSRTVTGAVYTAPAGRTLLVDAVCSGSGGASVGPVTLTRCDGTPSSAVVPGRSLSTVRVRADASTTWRFTVVDSPPLDTNAALQYPASALLQSSSVADRVAVASGTGPGQVALTSATTGSRVQTVRVELACTGKDVVLSTADGSLPGARVGTCFDGWSYAWTVSRAVLPGTLRVSAPGTATWRLVVLRG